MSTFSCTDDESNNNNDLDFLTTLYVDYMSQPSRACAMFVRYEFRGVRLVSFLFTPYALLRDELHAHFSLVTSLTKRNYIYV